MVRLITKPGKSLVLVERDGRIVNGVNDDHGDAKTISNRQNLHQCRHEEHAAKPAPLVRGIERQSANEHSRNGIIAAEMLVAVPASRLRPGEGKAVQSEEPDNPRAGRHIGTIDKHIRYRRVVSLIALPILVKPGIEHLVSGREVTRSVPVRIEALDHDRRRATR